MDDGGADVIGYVLEMQEEGAEDEEVWTKTHEKTLRTTDYIVPGLVTGKKYYFRVAGVNVNGVGEFSDCCSETEPVERIGTFVYETICGKHKYEIIRSGFP